MSFTRQGDVFLPKRHSSSPLITPSPHEMQSTDSKRSRKREYPRTLAKKLPERLRRKSSSVPAPVLAAPSGGSQPHLRPDTPSESIQPVVITESEDALEAPAVSNGRSSQPTTLHADERKSPPSATADPEPQPADGGTFEGSENVPCFNEAVKRFKLNYEDRYKAIFEGKSSVLDMILVSPGSNLDPDEGSNKPMGGIESFLQSCKTYLPSLGNVQTIAMALSRLDPHGIVPLVVTSVFFVIQVSS